MSPSASVTSLVLDAGPLILNTALPPATSYYTTSAVLAELKDESVRRRVETLASLSLRSATKASVDFVREFARKTGDLQVLSSADLGILALTYELECEQNHGDWRLRNAPGQARINGAPPSKDGRDIQKTEEVSDHPVNNELSEDLSDIHILEPENEIPVLTSDETAESDSISDEDDGWITPGNIKAQQAKARNEDQDSKPINNIKVACATHDFAMQNVLLQIGLNLISGDGQRITSIKTWILRCHACFKTTRQMEQKFCPSCGGATLLRTSISTDSKGRTQVHLKKNMQWNNRGTVFSIPKQQAGTANMKGRANLILRADQREVEKLQKRDKYKKEVDLLDPDYIPSIISGRRDHEQLGMKIGHGKANPNSNRKR